MRENAFSFPNVNLELAKRWILFLSVLLMVGQTVGGSSADFKVYWLAANQWLAGGFSSLYELNSATPFKYHPITIFLFLPFAKIPFVFAKTVWAILTGLFFGDALRRLVKHYELSRSDLFFTVLFVIHGLTWQVKFANVTVLLLWLFSIFISSPSGLQRAFVLGLLIVIKPYWGLLVLPAVIDPKRRHLLLAVLIPLACTAVFYAWMGSRAFDLFGQWQLTLSDPIHNHNFPKADNQSWFAFCYRYLHPSALRTAVYAGGVALSLWLWFVSGFSETLAAFVILWIGPLSWIHQQLFLLPYFAEQKLWRFRPWLGIFAWICLNGTGELFWGHAGFSLLHFLGVPILAYLVLMVFSFIPSEYNLKNEFLPPRTSI